MSTETQLQAIIDELKAIRAIFEKKQAASQAQSQAPQNNNGGGNQGNSSGGNKQPKRSDEKLSTCNRCGSENVVWRKSRAGKSYLVNVDGAYHSTTCGK